jgi:arylsulfatase A-like enzyme
MNTKDSAIPLDTPSMAESFKKAGYQTVAFVDSKPKGFLGEKRGFAKAFDRYDHAPHQDDHHYEYDMAGTVEAARRWLDGYAKKGPFFLFLHTKSVHGTASRKVKGGDALGLPYDKPEPYRSRYLTADQAKLAWKPRFVAYLRRQNQLLAEGKVSPKEYPKLRIEALKSQYDAGIYYVDHHFGKLLAILDDMGLSDNTVVLLTSDHGEAFLEHRFFLHNEVYNQLLHVPLIIRVPGESEGKVLHTPVGIEDVVPTLLQLGGADAPKEVTGKALPMDEKGKDHPRGFYGYYQFGSYLFKDEFSFMEGSWKLVLHKYDGNRWLPELYNLAIDPREQRPVESDPKRRAAMQKSLLAWLSDYSKTRERTIQMDDETLQDLRSLGYTN